MNVLALCAGAGGLEIGVKIAAPESRSVCYVEREAFAAACLVARMEDEALDSAPVWSDLKTFDGKPWRGVVDCVTGGYPCQPFSTAGKMRGDKDPRHLWPHVARIVGEVRPELCFFENVGNHLRLGFRQVHHDLSGLGYRVAAGLFTAKEVGCPQKRERLFIMADAIRDEFHGPQGQGGGRGGVRQGGEGLDGPKGVDGGQRQRRGQPEASEDGTEPRTERSGKKLVCPVRDGPQGVVADGAASGTTVGRPFELSLFPPRPDDLDGWEEALRVDPSVEPAVCRMADGMADWLDRLRTSGNGVVPLVAAYAWRILSDCHAANRL